MISRAISTALAAGLAAGLCLFLVQRSFTLPLIHNAEAFESHAHEESAPDPFASEPLRSISTLLGDVFVGVGFGLIMTGVFIGTGKEGWLAGLVLGAVGFVVFQVAPATVVPPAVPGMKVAPLVLRQIGWLTAVISATVGITLVYKARGFGKLVGILIAATPAILFRTLLPISPPTTSLHPLELIDQIFITRTLASMLVFWLILGTASGYLFARGRKNPQPLRFADGRT
jgi:cobalt transporter subunit CbtA